VGGVSSLPREGSVTGLAPSPENKQFFSLEMACLAWCILSGIAVTASAGITDKSLMWAWTHPMLDAAVSRVSRMIQ